MRCTQCGCQWNLDGEQRIITNQVLTKVCKGAGTKGSPPLSEFFKKKTDTNSPQDPETRPQTVRHEAPDTPDTRPQPRRLHFSTQLDAVEDHDEDDDGSPMAVDFF